MRVILDIGMNVNGVVVSVKGMFGAGIDDGQKRAWQRRGEKDAGPRGKVAAPATNFQRRHCIRGRGCADAEKEKFFDDTGAKG